MTECLLVQMVKAGPGCGDPCPEGDDDPGDAVDYDQEPDTVTEATVE